MAKRRIPGIPSACYVYEIAVDGVVRYVGKGTGDRVFVHMKTAKRIANRRVNGESFWVRKLYNQLAKAFSLGSSIVERIVISGLSDVEAFDRELFEIKRWPKGQLWNSIEGGPGNTSDYSRTLWANPEFRAKQAASREARREVVVKSMSKARQIRWSDPDQRKRQSARGKIAMSHLAKFHAENPGFRSENTIEAWAKPEFRKKISAARVAQWEKPEAREKMASYMKDVWANPDVAQKISATLKARWQNDPEYRAAGIARLKAASAIRWQNREKKSLGD